MIVICRCKRQQEAGEEGRLAIEALPALGKSLSYLIPGIAIAREDNAKYCQRGIAGSDLQQRFTEKDHSRSAPRAAGRGR